MQSTIEITTDSEPQADVEHMQPLKQPVAEGPAALPAHILAFGEHHRLADSTWWIGPARPAYEEVSHLQGIVIYNRNTHIFLSSEEARAAQALIQQAFSGINR